MPSDRQIIEFHKSKRDKIAQPRPVSHIYRLGNLQQANAFATEARQAGFLTGRSVTTDEYIEVTVEAAHALVDESGDIDPAFATIASIGEAHGATKCIWETVRVRSAGGDGLLRLLSRARNRTRIRNL